MQSFIKEAWNALGRLAAAYGLDILGALAIVICGLIAAGWAARATRRLAERSEHIGPTLAPVLSKTARLSVLALVAVAVLDKVGVDTTSILTALGALGLGVGLALKDTLSDLAAGIVLLVLRPFEAGHDVSIAGIDGTVESIDLFETKLIGIDGVPVSLANKKIRDAAIRNFTKAERRRFDLNIGVAYGADVDKAIAVILETLAGDERVLTTPAPIVNTVELADSAVTLVARINVVPSGSFAIQLDVRRKLKLALDEAGIEIPFPQRVMHQAAAA